MKEGLLLYNNCFIILEDNNLHTRIIKITYNFIISTYPNRNKTKYLLIK